MDKLDKKIFDIFDYDDEIVTIEAQDDLFDPARIKELTMKKINGGALGAEIRKTPERVRPLYRTLLIAAVIAVLLAGTAMAVYQITVKDVQMGEPYTVTVTNVNGGEASTEMTEERISLSLNGIVGSPEYQAYIEWTTWLDVWREENPEPWAELGVDDSWHETPLNYSAYYDACFAEQAEKLDEITEKYGLSLHTVRAFFDSEQDLYEVLGVKDVFGEALPVTGEYVYDDGSFKAYCPLSKDKKQSMELFCAAEGSFTMIGSSIATGYEQWNYTAADGTAVVFAVSEGKSFLGAKLDGAFVSASFYGITERTELENYADNIHFAVLNKVFAPGTDRSAIAEAAAAQKAAFDKKEAEREAAEAAAIAESNAFEAQHTEEEWAAIVFEELGSYDVPEAIEGFEAGKPGVLYTQEWYAISQNYVSDTGTYQLRYERDWADEAHSRSTTREEYDSLRKLDAEYRGDVRDIQLAGNDAYIAFCGDNGIEANMGTAIACYVESRDLLLSVWDRSSCLTEEQLLDLAAQFIESVQSN